MSRTVDLNADLGEGTAHGQDEALLDLVTSANVACGFHAGDPDRMAGTVRLALARGVAVGAHPSLPDREGFGRRSMAVTPAEAYNLVLYQVGALAGFVRVAGGRLAHVKPHGSLYNQAAADPPLAEAIAAAVLAFDPELILVGLAGSHLIAAGRKAGLAVAREGFADRRYERDGSLTPRQRDDALIRDPDEAGAQAVRLVERGEAIARDGSVIPVAVDTVCLHGDSSQALAFARRIAAELAARGIVLAAPRKSVLREDPK